jgi:hypothetical protein
MRSERRTAVAHLRSSPLTPHPSRAYPLLKLPSRPTECDGIEKQYWVATGSATPITRGPFPADRELHQWPPSVLASRARPGRRLSAQSLAQLSDVSSSSTLKGARTEEEYSLTRIGGIALVCASTVADEHGVPMTPVDLAGASRKESVREERRGRGIAWDEIWCVFDGDAYPK